MLANSTAQGIAEAIILHLPNLKLDSTKLLGIGVDNAIVNTGLNNGVCEILKMESNLPHLVMIRCVCHSLQLAVSGYFAPAHRLHGARNLQF